MKKVLFSFFIFLVACSAWAQDKIKEKDQEPIINRSSIGILISAQQNSGYKGLGKVGDENLLIKCNAGVISKSKIEGGQCSYQLITAKHCIEDLVKTDVGVLDKKGPPVPAYHIQSVSIQNASLVELKDKNLKFVSFVEPKIKMDAVILNLQGDCLDVQVLEPRKCEAGSRITDSGRFYLKPFEKAVSVCEACIQGVCKSCRAEVSKAPKTANFHGETPVGVYDKGDSGAPILDVNGLLVGVVSEQDTVKEKWKFIQGVGGCEFYEFIASELKKSEQVISDAATPSKSVTDKKNKQIRDSGVAGAGALGVGAGSADR